MSDGALDVDSGSLALGAVDGYFNAGESVHVAYGPAYSDHSLF